MRHGLSVSLSRYMNEMVIKQGSMQINGGQSGHIEIIEIIGVSCIIYVLICDN
jgi:hypothetical protein